MIITFIEHSIWQAVVNDSSPSSSRIFPHTHIDLSGEFYRIVTFVECLYFFHGALICLVCPDFIAVAFQFQN